MPLLSKIVSPGQARQEASRRQAKGQKVVFTNGCFDLLHAGHVTYLSQARQMGDFMILGLNSDASVRFLNKGPERPLVPQDQRALVLAGLWAVDLVVIFDEPTPYELIKQIVPDVLIKGGDWPVESIVGADIVLAQGGQVLSLPLLPGLSTTQLAQRIRDAC